jgi:hypothetical protein
MPERPKQISPFFSRVFPWLVLAILGIFTYAKFFVLPYTGFIHNSSGGEVRIVFVENPSNQTLIAGDHLLKVGEVTWEEFSNDLYLTLFEKNIPGDIVPIVVERDQQILEIPWMLPGRNQAEFLDRFNSVLIMAYLFWVSGFVTILFVRPIDKRWRTMTAFFFMTALWLAAGSLSGWHIWGSAIFLRFVIWLCVPLYLRLHWMIPHPLGKLPSGLVPQLDENVW